MKYTTLILLLGLHIQVTAQETYNGSYVDTAGHRINAYLILIPKGRYYYDFTRIGISDNGRDYRIVPADAIREFTVWGIRYFSALFGEKHIIMRVIVDGRHLKRLFWLAGPKYFNQYYCVDGVIVPINGTESKEDMKSDGYAEYPLLAELARADGFDDLNGYEGQLIFEEYDKWIDADSLQKKDTSMALKGVIDANKVRLPKKYFWRSFWYVHATGIIGMAIRKGKDLEPGHFDIPIYNQQLMQDHDYAKGYNFRMYTRITKLIVKGQVMGLFLPPLVFI